MSDTNRIQITAAIGLVGLITAVTLILTDAMRDVSHAWTGAAGFICLAAIGAAAAGYICAGLFGRNGVWGWWCAGCGAVSSTALGAMLAGTIFAPVYGTVFAPVIILASLVFFPIAGVVWLLGMSALHLYALNIRACGSSERAL